MKKEVVEGKLEIAGGLKWMEMKKVGFLKNSTGPLIVFITRNF